VHPDVFKKVEPFVYPFIFALFCLLVYEELTPVLIHVYRDCTTEIALKDCQTRGRGDSFSGALQHENVYDTLGDWQEGRGNSVFLSQLVVPPPEL
jgi:hypothetical protein